MIDTDNMSLKEYVKQTYGQIYTLIEGIQTNTNTLFTKMDKINCEVNTMKINTARIPEIIKIQNAQAKCLTDIKLDVIELKTVHKDDDKTDTKNQTKKSNTIAIVAIIVAVIAVIITATSVFPIG